MRRFPFARPRSLCYALAVVTAHHPPAPSAPTPRQPFVRCCARWGRPPRGAFRAAAMSAVRPLDGQRALAGVCRATPPGWAPGARCGCRAALLVLTLGLPVCPVQLGRRSSAAVGTTRLSRLGYLPSRRPSSPAPSPYASTYFFLPAVRHRRGGDATVAPGAPRVGGPRRHPAGSSQLAAAAAAAAHPPPARALVGARPASAQPLEGGGGRRGRGACRPARRRPHRTVDRNGPLVGRLLCRWVPPQR